MGKLIAIEDVEKLWRYKHNPDVMTVDPEGQYITLNNIYHLPQIDIVGEIEKMIEEYENEQKRISKGSSLHYDLSMYIKTLQELLQKFKS